MGGTKSKVDDTPDEESDTSSQTSDSHYRNNKYNRPQHDQQGGKQKHSNRNKQQSDISTPSPDEILDKPFRYQSRKEKLLESLNPGAGNRYGESSNDDGTSEKGRDGKISVQKIVDHIHANLHTKSGSTSSIRVKAKKPSKILTLSNDSNSLINRDKKTSRRKSSSGAVASFKEVKPTGVEEKIIESLIQPRKRQGSVSRSVETKNSALSIKVLSNPVAVSFDNDPNRNAPPKPPDPPPIDFSEGAESEGDSQKANKAISTLTTSIQGNDLKPLDSILPTKEPTHLKELKLRFSNDVPRSPHEDNLNSLSITEKSTSKQSEKPLNQQRYAPSNPYFTNNVPVADSLHILADEPRYPKVVICGAKDEDKRSNEHKVKSRKSQESQPNCEIQLEDETVSSKHKGKKKNQPCSSSVNLKPAIKRNQDNDIIKCFPVRTEYNEENEGLPKEKHASSERRGRERDRRKNSNVSHLKTARTQTSSLGLVDSGVQTLPDLGLQGQENRKAVDTDYEAAIDKKARRVLRRVSADRSVDRKAPKERRGRRYRNGSTQWEEVDLLDNSSCSMLNQKKPSVPKERPHSSTSRKRAELKETQQVHRRDSIDCQNCCSRNEVCCMHVQLIPDPPADRRSSRRRSQPRVRHTDLLDKQEPKDCTRRKDRKNRDGCSCSGFSSEKLSVRATYSTSSVRSEELSLLSPFRSSSTVRSKNKPKESHGTKNEEVYRQMEELGLGFLRDGEWVARRMRWNDERHNFIGSHPPPRTTFPHSNPVQQSSWT